MTPNIFRLPHPWWHYFFTNWIGGRQGGIGEVRYTHNHYRCGWCRRSWKVCYTEVGWLNRTWVEKL